VTAVQAGNSEHYQKAKRRGAIEAEERHGDWLYYAIKEGRDVPFKNASAWVFVTERYKVHLPAVKPRGRSAILGSAFAGLLGDTVAANARDGEIPEEARRPDFVVRHTRELERAFPGILETTEEEEKRFLGGKFPDGMNREALDAVIRRLSDLEAALPAVAVSVVDQHKAGLLKGARLEFGRRLLEAVADKAQRALRAVAIGIGADGALRLDGKPVADVTALAGRLKRSAIPRAARITVKAASRTRHADVVNVLDALKKAGYTSVSLAVD
jgi:hypothetical protein